MNESRQKVLNYLLGAGLLGAGAGVATSVLRQYNNAKKDEARAQATDRDDNVLYVHVPTGAKAASLLRDPLAVAGGALSAGTAAYLVNNYFRKKERERLQQELDEAQQVNVENLVNEANQKVAGAWGLAGGGGILLALATAALANKALEKSFPIAKAPGPDRLKPKRIVVVGRDDEPSEKEAALSSDEVAMLLCMGTNLEAGNRVGLGNVIKVAAAGYTDVLNKAAAEGTLFDTADLYAAQIPSPSLVRKLAAVEWLAANDRTSPQVAALAASIVQDRSPTYCAMAKVASTDGHEPELRLAAVLGMQAKRAQHREKLAAFYARVPDEKFALGVDLADMLGSALVDPGQEETAGMEGDTSDESDLPIDDQTGVALDPTTQNVLRQIQVAAAAPARSGVAG